MTVIDENKAPDRTKEEWQRIAYERLQSILDCSEKVYLLEKKVTELEKKLDAFTRKGW